jgi:hypothetical protein
MQHMLLMISSEAPPARRQSSQPRTPTRKLGSPNRAREPPFWSPARGERCEPRLLQIWSICACGCCWVAANLGGVAAGGWRGRSGWWGATVLLGGKGQCGTSQLAKCWGSIGGCALERESRFLAGPVVSGI